ncbi:MAG: InlB B-repeat-containing protein, partial [Clostridia bacterium]|nr:InlB B-repeat-containing protein [Clostridia bacterium]
VNLPSSQAAKYDENITLAINSMSRNNSAATTSFTVTFDINGGNSTVPSSQTNTKYTAYSADGWSRTPSGSRAYTSGQSVSNLTSTQNGTFNLFPYFASTTVYNPITLPAAATHADTNLGTVTFKYHDNVTAETTSTAYTTYAFAGWGTTTSGGRVGGAEESYTPDRARTLYALWTATAHSATFPSPSKTGYTFAGWYTAPTGGDLVTSYTGTDNVTYYAHWVANNYYIKYNQGQASSTTNLPAQQTAAFDAYVNLATNSMTKNNSADEDSFTVTYSKGTADSTAPAAQTNKKYTKYTADGWATSSGGNRAYTSGQSVRNLTTVHGATVNLYPAFSSQVIQKSINLAAAATKNNTNRGKITFNYNYTGSSNTELYAYDVWAFSGWYDAESGGNKLGNANAAYTPNGNKSAYPHFTSTAHSPTFPSPSRTGYTFAGWYTQPTGGSQVTSYTGTSDVTYYAQWDHIHSYTTVVTPPTCTQQGYTTYTCLCGDSYVSDYVPANGHTPSAWKMTVNPTVTHAGKMVRVCTVCGTTLDEMDVPQLIDNRVTGITLSENEIYLNVAETKTLTATVEPATALNKNVIWTSSKPEVATVADGEIRAVSPGTTVIIAKTEDSGHKDFCIVQVSAITAVNGSNVDNDNGVIYGLTSNLPNADGYLLLADDSMTLSYSRDKIGTGTEIRVMKDDEVINTYEAVIFGDVDGDSWYDGQDALFVNCLANGLLTKEQVGDSAYMAADCNHDGVIDDLDVAVLEQAGVLLANVDQTKSEEELLETESYVEYLNLIDQNPTLDEEVTDEPIEEPIVSTAKTLLDRIIIIIKAILVFVTNWLPKI